MGLRKRIVGKPICERCTMPIESKFYRFKSIDDWAQMHVTCAHVQFQKMYITKGRAVPVLDVKVHADMIMDLMCVTPDDG